MQNVIKKCAEEFLDIQDDAHFDEELKTRGLQLFLLDGKAIVTDETYTHNKTTFNFCYTEVSIIMLNIFCITMFYIFGIIVFHPNC